jgi:hypothetical protein
MMVVLHVICAKTAVCMCCDVMASAPAKTEAPQARKFTVKKKPALQIVGQLY